MEPDRHGNTRCTRPRSLNRAQGIQYAQATHTPTNWPNRGDERAARPRKRAKLGAKRQNTTLDLGFRDLPHKADRPTDRSTDRPTGQWTDESAIEGDHPGHYFTPPSTAPPHLTPPHLTLLRAVASPVRALSKSSQSPLRALSQESQSATLREGNKK